MRKQARPTPFSYLFENPISKLNLVLFNLLIGWGGLLVEHLKVLSSPLPYGRAP